MTQTYKGRYKKLEDITGNADEIVKIETSFPERTKQQQFKITMLDGSTYIFSEIMALNDYIRLYPFLLSVYRGIAVNTNQIQAYGWDYKIYFKNNTTFDFSGSNRKFAIMKQLEQLDVYVDRVDGPGTYGRRRNA